jgi:nucleotide-binding universal stress UspA family protein
MIFHKILCPTDFSEASYYGLQIAAEMAIQNNAELCVLHVEPPLEATTELSDVAPYAQADAARGAIAIANLCNVIEERIPAAAHSHPLLKRGETAVEIRRAALEEHADLIVLTTHGATGLHPGALGCVAAGVLQSAPCPVLAVSARKETSFRQVQQTPAKTRSDAGRTESTPGIALRPDVTNSLGKALFIDGD